MNSTLKRTWPVWSGLSGKALVLALLSLRTNTLRAGTEISSLTMVQIRAW